MLNLSHEQMAAVMAAAAPLWPTRRSQFLRSVANRLADVARPTDRQVEIAIAGTPSS
jgi:hypothetical protein